MRIHVSGNLFYCQVGHAENKAMPLLEARAILIISIIIEPRCEKTGLRGFRPGPILTRLYSHRRWLEA